MPGTIVQTGTRPGASSLGDAPAATYFVAGQTERGDATKAVLVRSLSEFVAIFGQRVTYGTLFDDLEQYFNEGGIDAYVARVVGPAAAVGTLTLQDLAGSPQPTVRVDALSPGAWSATVSVQVDVGSQANTWKLTVLTGGQAVEVYNNLTDPASAVAFVNSQSQYVKLTNLASVTAAPANNPRTLVATALSAGSDDRGSVTASLTTAALARFTPDLGPGAVATPGLDAATVGTAVIAHCSANNRLALLAPPIASTGAGVRTAVVALRALTGSECAGVFYPWVQVPDGAGGVRTISPEGYVAGVRARTQAAAGPWQAPAGVFAQARHIAGVEAELDRPTADALNDDNVSVIRRIAGTLRLYGWRSISPDNANYRFLTAKDTLNYVASLAALAMEQFVFRTIDSRGLLFSDVATEIKQIVDVIAAAGGLYALRDPNGQPLDPGYRIDTGPSVNTLGSQQRGEVRANVALRTSPVGELVRLSIVKVPLTQAI